MSPAATGTVYLATVLPRPVNDARACVQTCHFPPRATVAWPGTSPGKLQIHVDRVASDDCAASTRKLNDRIRRP